MKKLFIVLGFILGTAQAQTFPVATLLQNGSTNARINLVFVADGYQASEQTKFINDAQTVLTNMFQVAPYSTYKNFFNAYAIQVPSVQSGASHPHTAPDCPALTTQPISTVNNYFGSTFDGNNIHREITSNFTLVTKVLNANTPYYDLPIVLVNTPYYGGLAEGQIAVISADGSITTAQILEHELGHSLGGLGDEYSYGGCNGIEEWNTTTNFSNPRWSALLTPGVALPTSSSITDNSVVGAFLGANYCPTTWYRPSPNCMMRTLGQPFCPVCMERMVFAMNYYATLIDGANPSPGTISLPQNQSQTFTPNLLYTVPTNTVGSVWTLDGTQVSLNSTYTISGLSLGKHTLVLTAHDNSTAVKTPSTLAQMKGDSVTWTINVTASVSPTPTPLPSPTATPVPTATPTPLPTATPNPTSTPSTPTPTPVPSPSATPIPAPSVSPSPKPTPTATPAKPVITASVNGIPAGSILSGQTIVSLSGSDSMYIITTLQLIYTDSNGVAHGLGYLMPYAKSQKSNVYFQTSQQANGSGFINAKVTDSAGNTFSSPKISITIQN